MTSSDGAETIDVTHDVATGIARMGETIDEVIGAATETVITDATAAGWIGATGAADHGGAMTTGIDVAAVGVVARG